VLLTTPPSFSAKMGNANSLMPFQPSLDGNGLMSFATGKREFYGRNCYKNFTLEKMSCDERRDSPQDVRMKKAMAMP
jgi:hypothetical protein